MAKGRDDARPQQAGPSFEYRLNRTPVGVVMLDAELAIRSVNPVALRLLAPTGADLFGANILDLTLILPVCSFVSGQALPVSAQSLALDMPACLLITLLALLPLQLWRARRIAGAASALMGFMQAGDHLVELVTDGAGRGERSRRRLGDHAYPVPADGVPGAVAGPVEHRGQVEIVDQHPAGDPGAGWQQAHQCR